MYFNTPASVFKAITDIAATSSKKEKEAIVKSAGVPLFMRVVKAAYDPFRIYGIGKESVPKKTPGLAPGANTLGDDYAWNILDALATQKLTGNAAREEVQKAVDLLDDPSSELFRRILMKDMRAGFTDGTINRVFPGTFQEFPYMRCSLPEKSSMVSWLWEQGIIVQEKADGMFTNVNVRDDGYIWLTTRQGTPIPMDNMPGLHEAIKANLKPSTQSHGELTVFQDGKIMPREEGNGVLNHILDGGSPAANQVVMLDIWDQIPLAAVKPKGNYGVPYKQRLADLIKQVQIGGEPQVRVIPTKIVKSKADAWAYYRELLRQNKEGVVCKLPTAIWRDGTSKDQVKLKLAVPVELEVEDGNMGAGKNAGKISSLRCRSRCRKLVVNVPCRGDKMIEDVTANLENWKSKIITAKANSIMEPENEGDDYSLFLPIYVDERKDKSQADTLEEIREQFRNAVEAV